MEISFVDWRAMIDARPSSLHGGRIWPAGMHSNLSTQQYSTGSYLKLLSTIATLHFNSFSCKN
jgi:hypothetical protein